MIRDIRVIRGHFKRMPKRIRWVRAEGSGILQLLFQLLQHRFRKALFERTTVENLQCIDFRLVFGEVISEGLNKAGGFGLRGGVEALAEDFVGRVDVDGLLGFLFQSFERYSKCRFVERGAGFNDELLLSGFEVFRRDFLGLSAWSTGGTFCDGVRVEGAEQCAGESGGRFASGGFGDLLTLCRFKAAIEAGKASGQ